MSVATWHSTVYFLAGALVPTKTKRLLGSDLMHFARGAAVPVNGSCGKLSSRSTISSTSTYTSTARVPPNYRNHPHRRTPT